MRSFAAAIALLIAGPAGAADLTLDAASNFLIDATVNGRPVRLRVDPAGSEHVILNPDAARRLGLRGSLIGSQARIGPVRLRGSSNRVRLAIGAWSEGHRLLWMDRPIVAGADGLISPASLPFERVVFALAPPRPGEMTIELPMRMVPRFGLSHTLTVAGRPVALQLSLAEPETIATAAAGAILAEAHGGGWSGEAREAPIRFGVLRPVRAMTLARPAAVGHLAFDRLLVRTGDNRGALDLPGEPDADPGEVVVTGASRQRAWFMLTLGRDRLGACSSIVWDNRARRLTLNCANPPAAP